MTDNSITKPDVPSKCEKKKESRSSTGARSGLSLSDYEKRYHNSLLRKIRSLRFEKSKLPEKIIYPAKNGSTTNWYLKLPYGSAERKYVSKKSESFSKLVKHTVISTLLDACEQELSAYEMWLARREKTQDTQTKLFAPGSPYTKYFDPDHFKKTDKQKAWEAEPYHKSTLFAEGLTCPTKKGEMVRSKSEALIADTLFELGIPYRYECELVLDGKVFHPDFTIYNPSTDSILFWEHLGAMDSRDYLSNNIDRFAVFAANGILPSRNLIITSETKRFPFTGAIVNEFVRKTFLTF